VADSGRELTADEVRGLLAEVGEILAAKGLRASIYVVGGAAIALTLNNRRITRDIDAAFRDHPQEFRAAAAIVGQRHGLAPNWINSDAIGFTSNRPIGEEDKFEVPGLQVISASPEHLLAMKVRASMSRDEDDDDYPPILPGHSGPAQYTRAYTHKDGTHVSGSTRSPGQNRGR